MSKNAFRDEDIPQNEVVLNQEELLKKQMNGKSSELRNLEEELQLLEAAAEMLFDGQQPVQFHNEELTKQVEAKRLKLKEMEYEWAEVEKPLQEKKGNLKQSLLELHPEAYAKFTRYEEIEVEIESVLAEIKRREEEISKLSSDLEKQPKIAPRKSHIERINEITRNSRKQDADIQHILKDTREVQLESNTIQERLNRTELTLWLMKQFSGKPRKTLLLDKPTGFLPTCMRVLNRLLKRFLALTGSGEMLLIMRPNLLL